jgi:protein-S-isoprenylcysteine O-methyltransferase Ste14
MDSQLIALIGMVIAFVILATRQHRRSWSRHPGWQYQRVFSVGFAGLLFLVAGLIGWDLRNGHGLFQGTKWVEGPVWWQAGLGAGLMLLAGFWARRVPPPPRQRTAGRRHQL